MYFLIPLHLPLSVVFVCLIILIINLMQIVNIKSKTINIILQVINPLVLIFC